jgi:hypothetical protein
MNEKASAVAETDISEEQAADLRELQGMAEAEPGAAPVEAVEEQVSEAAIQEMTALCVGMAADIISASHPALPAVYDEATRTKLEKALFPVMQKYGCELPDWLRPWIPEIMLGFSVVTVGFATMKAIKEYKPAPEAAASANG